VERVVLNALAMNAALPPDIYAFGDRHRLQEKPIRHQQVERLPYN